MENIKTQEQHVVVDPSILMGKPVIGGTRIPVELILEKLAAGETEERILSEHPRLTAAGIRSALSHAAKTLRADVVFPVSALSP